MSASPAGSAPSANANGNGRPQPQRRLALPKPTNPLVQRKPKKPAASKPAPPTSAPRPGATGHLGAAALGPRTGGVNRAPGGARPVPKDALTLEDRPFGDTTPSLFARPPAAGTYTDYKVVTTKKELLQGLRLHVARLASQKPVDIKDQSQFIPPLYLLRRDIRAPIPGSKEELEMKAEQDVKPEVNEEDAEREAAKAAAKAEIAPSQGTTKPRRQQPTKKTQQVFLKDQTAEQKYKAQLKYEEALPWHLEDDEHKQIWMGTYEEMSSNTWTQFRFEERNGEKFAVITPLEKWYKFTPKSRVNAEVMRQHEEQQLARMKKEESEEPDFMKAFERAIKKEEDDREDTMAARGRLFIAKGRNDELGTKADEELDFEEDWADDEAPPEIEGEEEDVKDIEKRIKKDQLKSNVFDMVGTAEYEDEDEKERRELAYRKKVGKKTAKALVKREHNAIYESDEENEYAEKSDSTDTEEEILREKEKKEAEAKAAAAATAPALAPAAGKTGSGASSRNNTPGHRPSKHPEPLGKSGMKRPGSPNLSEASGNESAANRKKLKKSKLGGSKLVSASQPPSRPRSPANGPSARPPAVARASFAGSGSDTDTPAQIRMRLNAGGATATAAAARSPSPPNGTPGASRTGSRATSPDAAPTQRFRSVPSNEVLRSLIPPQGLHIALLSKLFDITTDERKVLIGRMKEISVWDKDSKKLMPLPANQASANVEQLVRAQVARSTS